MPITKKENKERKLGFVEAARVAEIADSEEAASAKKKCPRRKKVSKPHRSMPAACQHANVMDSLLHLVTVDSRMTEDQEPPPSSMGRELRAACCKREPSLGGEIRHANAKTPNDHHHHHITTTPHHQNHVRAPKSQAAVAVCLPACLPAWRRNALVHWCTSKLPVLDRSEA